MRVTRKLSFLAIVIILIAVAGCDSTTPQSIPASATVSGERIPQPESGGRVYYDLPHIEPDYDLKELVEASFEVELYWRPRQESSCECAMCVTANIIQLAVPDGRVRDFGFEDDPQHWVLNCGVDRFLEYDFQE